MDNHVQQLLSRLTDLEAQVKQQWEFMAAGHERQSIPPHEPPGNEPYEASPDRRYGLNASSQPTVETRPEATDIGVNLNTGIDVAVNQSATDAPQTRMSHDEPRFGLDDDNDDGQDDSLTIPIGHWTTTGSLLLLPQIRSLIGDYPENFFLQLESSRASSMLDSHFTQMTDNQHLPELRAEETDAFVDAFFKHVHPSFPVIDRDMLIPLYHNVIKHGLRHDAKSALCLVIFALGKMATHMVDFSSPEEQDNLHGFEYFSPGYRIATAEWGLSFDPDRVLPLALIHSALYLQHMNLPLQAWKMVHLTSVNLQYSVAMYAVSFSQTFVRILNAVL